MSFSRAVAFELKEEGGLVDNPNDPGGITNHGIALNRHPNLTRQDILDMTPAKAADIFHGPEYWGAIHGDELDVILQLPMLDCAVLEGPHVAILCLQRALGTVAVDGIIGPETLKAANLMAGQPLVVKFSAERIVEMSKDFNWALERRGWSRRVIASSLEAFL